MRNLFKIRQLRRQKAVRLYQAVVSAARQPVFYDEYGVPDTVDGRFDMILLHAALVMRCLSSEGKEGQRLSQAVFDVMFKDMERSLREMGIGDLSVPHHMKRMMKASKGRYYAYDQGFSEPALLKDALRRNLFGTRSDAEIVDSALEQVVFYIQRNIDALNGQAGSVLESGEIYFELADDDRKNADIAA